MGLSDDIQTYREKTTGMVGLVPNPIDHSTDNGLLFTATWLALVSDDERIALSPWFIDLLNSLWKVPGLLTRYPGDGGEEAQDDNIGVVSVSAVAAEDILTYGLENRWCFNVPDPGKWSWTDWLGRFPGFPQFVKLSACLSLNVFEQTWLSLAFLLNLFEGHSQTSGKCLLFLQGLRINRAFPSPKLLNLSLKLWRWVMMKRYPRGMKDVYTIYFGSSHPFTKYAPSDFG